MNFFHYLQNKIGPAEFTKWSLRAAALWLLAVYPLLLWFSPGVLPSLIKPAGHLDFYQYYSGAVVVRERIWDSLYATPKWDVYNAPNHFVPAYRTFLFDPAFASRNLAFYPEYNTLEGSDRPPKLKAVFPQGDASPEGPVYSYVYPPPTALLCSPLALVNFDCAANRLWPTAAALFLFFLTFFASQIYRILQGGAASYGEGLVALACLVFSTRGETTIISGNVNPILGGCVACCCYSLLRSRMLAFSCAYIPLIIFKPIGLAWLPLLVLGRKYGRALIYLTAITLILNGIVMAAAGIKVYRDFLSICPLLSIPVGHGLVPTLLRNFGFYPHLLYTILNLAGLGLLYYGYLKNGEKGWALNASRPPIILAAFLAGTLALVCLFNNVSWPAYGSNFLFFPLLGWMLHEGNLATGAWRTTIRAVTLLSFLILVGTGFWYLLFGKATITFFIFDLLFPYEGIIVPLFFLLIALRRLLIAPER